MRTFGSPASVIASVREDAEAEVERIRAAAESELLSIRADAGSAVVTIADRDARLAAARRERDEHIARQEWAVRRAEIEQRETWLQRVVATARYASHELPLDALVAEARSRLPEGEIVVKEDPRGGCVVSVGDVSFDNTFEARSRRLEPEWRSALSGMYRP